MAGKRPKPKKVRNKTKIAVPSTCECGHKRGEHSSLDESCFNGRIFRAQQFACDCTKYVESFASVIAKARVRYL